MFAKQSMRAMTNAISKVRLFQMYTGTPSAEMLADFQESPATGSAKQLVYRSLYDEGIIRRSLKKVEFVTSSIPPEIGSPSRSGEPVGLHPLLLRNWWALIYMILLSQRTSGKAIIFVANTYKDKSSA